MLAALDDFGDSDCESSTAEPRKMPKTHNKTVVCAKIASLVARFR
jgi:hypothetical protein